MAKRKMTKNQAQNWSQNTTQKRND